MRPAPRRDRPAAHRHSASASALRAGAGKAHQVTRADESVPAAWSAAVGLAALALYLVLAPSVSGDQDASELTLALATGGVPHPTGYPLYAIFGHLFCALLQRLGTTWSYAANAWSAAGAGLAIALYHALACSVVEARSGLGRLPRFGVALFVVALVGLDPAWTMSAAVAEVHSWHLAWIAAACLLYLTMARSLSARVAWSSRRLLGTTAAWGFTCGLGLAHHVSGALFAIPLTAGLVVALVRGRHWHPKLALLGLASALVPLSSYAFVGCRAFHPSVVQWPLLEPSAAGVLRHVTGGGYGGFFGRFAPADLQVQLLASCVYPFLFAGMGALLLFAWRATDTGERIARWGLLAAAAAQTLATFNYGVPDPAAYFLPPLWAGLLAVPLLYAAVRRHRTTRVTLTALATLGLAALAVPWFGAAWDRRVAFAEIDTHLHGLWNAIPYERGIVVWPSDMYCRLKEYQIFAGEKRELFVTSPNMLTFERPRRDFERRFGFDPLGGLRLRGPGDLGLVAENINRRTALPVIVVDAMGFETTMLPKPAAGDTSVVAPGAGGAALPRSR